MWLCAEDGIPIIGPKQVGRAIVRMLKGHGIKYTLPESTWQYYRKKGIGTIGAFRILRNFEKPAKFEVRSFANLRRIGCIQASG